MDIIFFFQTNPLFFLIIIGFLAAFIGSFLNVLIYRLPIIMEQNWLEEMHAMTNPPVTKKSQKMNLWLPFSHCIHCNHTIRPWHNIPVISYLWLGGKCHDCGNKIALRYPIIEALTCILSISIGWHFGVTWQTLAALCFTWVSIALTFIDLDHQLLPDQLTLFLLWLGLFFSLFHVFVSPDQAILGAIIGYLLFATIQLLFYAITGKIGMGQGDFKFLAALGAFMGWHMLPLIILLASVMGIVGAITNMLIKQDFTSKPLPFGPYLAVAGWIGLLWGDVLVNYYLYLL